MNRQLKKEIQKALAAPIPNQQEKARFIRMLPRPQISIWKFIVTQAAFFRKWTFLFSILLLFAALALAPYIDQNTLWVISAIVPFMGILTVTEGVRSMTCGMSELELSTRFSLKSVVLARLSILGLLNILVLCCLIPLCCIGNQFSLLQTGSYLLVPYLLTVNISLWLTRRFHNKEVVYGCMSVAILVSGANTGLRYIADFVYQVSYMNRWIILLIILMGKMIYEIHYTMKQTEEYIWNSSLTD